MKIISKIFEDLEYMELIKGHRNHKKGEVKLIACSRCTYNDYKKRQLEACQETMVEITPDSFRATVCSKRCLCIPIAGRDEENEDK